MYLVDKKPADGTVATEVLMTQKHSVKSTVLLRYFDSVVNRGSLRLARPMVFVAIRRVLLMPLVCLALLAILQVRPKETD